MGHARAGRAGRRIVGIAAAITAVVAAPAGAHESASFDGVTVSVGWSEEPAFVGVVNAVEVSVTDEAGAPVADPEASLVVQVGIGEERVTLPLARRDAGSWAATLLPTRAGTYRFHVTGEVTGAAIDLDVTCSDDTFDCVTEATPIEFPASGAGLADADVAARLERVDLRVATAREEAARAARLATAAAAVAALTSLGAVALAFLHLRSRKNS